MAYIEEALSESNATLKLKELEDAEMIKINSLNENYQSYNSVVIAGGNNGKLGKEQYENIDKILIETLKDKDKNIVGVQESNTKFSYVDLYFNDKVTTIDNVDEGIGKLSLVMVLQDSSIAGKFGKLEGSDSIIPYKKQKGEISMNPYISIIIPAYNEEDKIKDTLENIKDINEINEILVIDDGSSDKTTEIANSIESEKIKVFTLDKNRGKGYALNYGLKIAMKNATIIGFLDGDLGSTSSEVKKLITPILNNEADVIIAKFPPATKKGGLGFVKRLAKESVLEMTGKELDATLSGQRIFKKEVLEKFKEMPYGYGVEVGMTIDILKHGYTVKEVLVNMTHSETGRNLKGFIHRGKQFYHIKKVLRQKKKEWR